MKYSLLTYQIVSFSEVQRTNAVDSIVWANEMLELGFEVPSLFILASFERTANYYEVKEYVNDCIKELGLELKIGDEAILNYACFYILKIAQGEKVKENLKLIYEFCRANDYEKLIYDFYLLYWAWDDIDFEDTENNQYWKDANKHNIEEIVVNQAKYWIDLNEKSFELKFSNKKVK